MHEHQQHVSQHPNEVVDRYDESFWEDRYRSQPAIWSGRPNHLLVAEIAGLTPGAALDVGCGEGGDAVWLAQQGWTVTAADFSTVALERGAARAKELGVEDRVGWVHADLTTWQPPQTYDLINCQYLHLLVAEQEELLLRLAEKVAAGGTLLYVSHDVDEHVAKEQPHRAARFLPAARLAEALDSTRWEIMEAGLRKRPDAAKAPAGHSHDSLLRARRRP